MCSARLCSDDGCVTGTAGVKSPFVDRHATWKTLHNEQHKEEWRSSQHFKERPHDLHDGGCTDKETHPLSPSFAHAALCVSSYTWETFWDSLACLMLYNHLMILAFLSIAEMP